MSMVEECKSIKSVEKLQSDASGISEELHEMSNDDGSEGIQGVVWLAIGLGYQWRALVAKIGDAGFSPNAYRTLQPFASHAANLSLDTIDRTLQRARENKADGIRDLELWLHELKSIVKWFDCWPTSGSERRNKAREEIKRGEYCSVDEYVRMPTIEK